MTPAAMQAEPLLAGLRPLLRHPPLMAGSRKVAQGGASDQRLLATFPRAALVAPDDPTPLARLLGAALPDPMARCWQQAAVIHLGLDGADPDGCAVRKLYLEFDSAAAPEPDLAYLALKIGRRAALHQYHLLADPADLLAGFGLPPQAARAADLLAGRSRQLLRVAEPGTDRLSLDINLAEVEPTRALRAAVAAVVAGIDAGARPPSVWPSHLAVGRSAGGTLFATLYGWPEGPTP